MMTIVNLFYMDFNWETVTEENYSEELAWIGKNKNLQIQQIYLVRLPIDQLTL